MLADPVADQRQARAERVRDDVLRLADEDRPVADVREARDLLDHLGVVVRGQHGLALAALGHRQPADEVRQPAVRRALQLGVLVQVVVELPRLVSDPEVVLLGAGDVVEDHEVGEQDLVHPPDRLERVQLVTVGLRLDVARLVRQVPAGGMDALARGLEDARDGILREPVDRQPGVEPAELLHDREVAPGVAEADRRGDVERPLRPGDCATPGLWLLRAAPARIREVGEEQVEPDRVARVRAVSGSFHRDEPAAGRGREGGAAVGGNEGVLVALDHEHGAADAGHQLVRGRLVESGRPHRELERVGCRLERPADAVLDLLRGVRLREAASEEELQEAGIVALPVVAVLLRPALVGRKRLGEGHHPLRPRRRDRERRRHEDGADEALRVVCGQQQSLVGAAAVHDEENAVEAELVEQRERVRGRDLRAVLVRRLRPVGAAVAARVERQDAEVAGEIRHLPLPEARVVDRPGRQEQDRLRGVAEELVEDAHAVAVEVSLRTGLDRPSGGVRCRGRCDGGHQAATLSLISRTASVVSASRRAPTRRS